MYLKSNLDETDLMKLVLQLVRPSNRTNRSSKWTPPITNAIAKTMD